MSPVGDVNLLIPVEQSFNVEGICETSELSCNLLNSTGFISDPMRKLVELVHLTKSGRRDYEGGHLEQRILKDFRFEF